MKTTFVLGGVTMSPRGRSIIDLHGRYVACQHEPGSFYGCNGLTTSTPEEDRPALGLALKEWAEIEKSLNTKAKAIAFLTALGEVPDDVTSYRLDRLRFAIYQRLIVAWFPYRYINERVPTAEEVVVLEAARDGDAGLVQSRADAAKDLYVGRFIDWCFTPRQVSITDAGRALLARSS